MRFEKHFEFMEIAYGFGTGIEFGISETPSRETLFNVHGAGFSFFSA